MRLKTRSESTTVQSIIAIARGVGLRSHSRSERPLLRADDQKPEHGGEFGQKHWLEIAEESVSVIRSEEPSDADDYPGDAIKQKPVPEPARQEVRAHDQPSKRQQP